VLASNCGALHGVQAAVRFKKKLDTADAVRDTIYRQLLDGGLRLVA
jgi:hypothetical protein